MVTYNKPSNDGRNVLNRMYSLSEVNNILDLALNQKELGAATASYIAGLNPRSRKRALRRAVIRLALNIGE